MKEKKVILITGSIKGLGNTLARMASLNGYDVALNYRSDANEAERLVNELNCPDSNVIAIKGDVSVSDDVSNLVEQVISHFGRIDCLVNNAGTGDVIGLNELSESAFEETLRNNLVSAFMVSQKAWRHMVARGGRLVFLSSGAARTGGNLSAAYAASKAGLEGLMHYYATNLRQYNITSNAIAPSFFESDLLTKMSMQIDKELPMGRPGRPEELWPALRMILDTDYLTGQTIHVDAGRYMT